MLAVDRHLLERAQDAGDVERGRVDGVVDTRVADQAVHVERLGDAHRTRGAEPLGGRGGLQGGGVERRGRLGLTALLLGRGDRAARGAGDRGHDGLRLLGALEAVRGVPGAELAVAVPVSLGAKARLDLPVRLGHERLALQLALHDQRERGRLHATGALHVAEARVLGHGEVAREHGAPHQVDVLARLAGLREAVVHRGQLRERPLDLLFGDRREPRALHRRCGVDRGHERARIAADKLALAVEVGRDDDAVGLLGEALERADDLALGGHLADRRPHEVRQRGELPRLEVEAVGGEGLALGPRRRGQRIGDSRRRRRALLPHRLPLLVVHQLQREIDAEDVALQADRDPVLLVAAKRVGGRVVDLVGLGLAHGQDLRELLRGDVLLGDDQIHAHDLPGSKVSVPSIHTAVNPSLERAELAGACRRVSAQVRVVVSSPRMAPCGQLGPRCERRSYRPISPARCCIA